MNLLARVVILFLLLPGYPACAQSRAGFSGGKHYQNRSGIWFATLGDSNMAGQSSEARRPASPGPKGHVSIAHTIIASYADWTTYNGGDPYTEIAAKVKLNDAFKPNAQSGNKTSMMPSMALKGIPVIDRPINFIMGAYAGTDIANSGVNSKIKKGGEAYDWLLASMSSFPNIDLRAVLIMGPYWDVLNGGALTPAQLQAAYAAAVDTLADDVLADFGVPLIVGVLSPEVGDASDQDDIAAVEAGLRASVATNANLYLGPVTSDLTWESDHHHIHSMQTLGERWWQAAVAAGVTN